MVTKAYFFHVEFAAGSCALDPEDRSVDQALWRAQVIPEHVVCISSREDSSDPGDNGLARRRADALRSHFEKNSVDSRRILIEFPSEEGEAGSKFSRISEIYLYPRVASLSGDGEILTYRELRALQAAREFLLVPKGKGPDYPKEQLAVYSDVNWQRIVGFESMEEWAEKGAKHPLYPGGIPVRRQRGSSPWWKFW